MYSLFSFLECAALCAANSSCVAFYFNKLNTTCNLGNGAGLKIQANETLLSAALMVHVIEGVQFSTNGESNKLTSF
jgi:hypothetical protein